MPIDDRTPSRIWDTGSIQDIQEKARLGRYRIRAFLTARQLPTLEDLTFIPAGFTRVPLEGYRETCSTEVTLGTRHASKPLQLKTPIRIAGMSYGAMSRNAKEALGLGATRAGTSACTGDGGAGNLQMNGDDWDHCPRTILSRAMDDASSRGFKFMLGIEPEFFLIGKKPMFAFGFRSRRYSGQAVM